MEGQNNFREHSFGGGRVDLNVYWRRKYNRLVRYLEDDLEDLGALKVSIAVDVTLEKEDREITAALRAKSFVLLEDDDLGDLLRSVRENLSESLSNYTREGSGWVLTGVEGMEVGVARYVLLSGGSFVPLPIWIERKKAIVNVKNKDNECFRWAIRSALYPAPNNPSRCSTYPKDDLNWDGIEFPVTLEQIDVFESNNDFRINVYTCREEVIVPLRLKKDPNLHLFYYGGHYSWVKHPSRLFQRMTKNHKRKSVCYNCLLPFTSPKRLREHADICKGYAEVATRVEMPLNKEFYYQDYQKQLPMPYVIYADFESLITHCEEKNGNTTKTAKHEICSYGYVVVRQDGKAYKPQIYRGPNAANEFLADLKEVEEEIREKLKVKAKMIYTKEDDKIFRKSKKCHICDKTLLRYGRREKKCYKDGVYLGEAHWYCGKYEKGKGKDEKPSTHCIHCTKPFEEDFYVDKVRDHCHITGKFRGAAHWSCNASFRIDPNMEIPVFFHNLRGYDSHLLLQGVDGEEVKCIPNNKERYMSVTIGKLKFLDSMQFMNASLSSLAKSAELPISDKYGAERKGVYPYEWMDSWEKFKEPLPPKECFYSSLARNGIKDEDYEYAKEVWKKRGCKNMGDYHDIYLLSDVVILADVFQGFRAMCMSYYGLDPANFYTAPGLSWSALLKMTKPQLDLLTDYDMHLFIEQGIRGGVCGPSKRYAKANNPLVEYDSSRPKNYIYYLDANNLYGWAMSQPLPVRDFEWTSGSWEEFDVPADNPTGYILEVDLEYPQELHDAHNDFPMAPENVEIPFEMLSDYQKELMPDYKPYKKLVMSFLSKKRYVVHYRNLQLYLKHGLKIKKIHRVLKFTQEPWMKPYIDFNTQKRMQSKNAFEKNLFKLMNNSVFGKTMENIRKRVNIKIAHTEEEAQAYVSKPGYVRYVKMLNFWVIHMKKPNLFFNKPVYTGFCVLDLSKLLMYSFYYENLKQKYGDKCRLLYTDTDSLILDIETEDVYKDTLADIDEYDTSEYPNDHFLYDAKNKKVIGKMKDEMHGLAIKEYVGLRPKMYSVLHDPTDKNVTESKKAKGVRKTVIDKDIKHSSYVQVLNDKKEERHLMSSLRSYGHQMHNVTQEKVSLSPFDGKRYILEDGINTLAFGHYKQFFLDEPALRATV